MYLNFELLKAKELTTDDFLTLQICHQMVSESLIQWLPDSSIVEKLVNAEYVEFLKPRKDTPKYALARLSKKGKELLNDLQIPNVIEDDLIVWDWLEKKYKSLGKEVGNRKKGKLWLACFRVHSGFQKNDLVKLCVDFVKDDKNMEYSHRLDYVFFKPDNVFTTKFDLDSSKLWQFYLKNQEYYDRIRKFA
jgi:hypothetical protein